MALLVHYQLIRSAVEKYILVLSQTFYIPLPLLMVLYYHKYYCYYYYFDATTITSASSAAAIAGCTANTSSLVNITSVQSASSLFHGLDFLF